MKLTLYSTHCPQCEVLKRKLDQNRIPYREVNDLEIMIEKGFSSAPILEVEMDFKTAFNSIDFLIKHTQEDVR